MLVQVAVAKLSGGCGQAGDTGKFYSMCTFGHAPNRIIERKERLSLLATARKQSVLLTTANRSSEDKQTA